jgi:hypothetical protein
MLLTTRSDPCQLGRDAIWRWWQRLGRQQSSFSEGSDFSQKPCTHIKMDTRSLHGS